MVAQTVALPNIRKLFVPDPGMVLVEGDLARAESQVVAWESGDSELKHIFHSGIDIHKENAVWTYGDLGPTAQTAYYRRDRLKRCVYAIQNGGKGKKCGELLESPQKGQRFYDYWTQRFPAIPRWHAKIERSIHTRRLIENVWGYKFHWFDRTDGNLVGEAVPWITQSTIGITINKAMVALDELDAPIELLLQVHDSLVMQIPEREFDVLMPEIRRRMSIAIPYPDPLVIPVTLGYSPISWGDLQDWKG